MSDKSMAERRRKTSDPPSDGDTRTPAPARTDARSGTDTPKARSTRTGSSGSFSRLFGCGIDFSRSTSQEITSPPASVGGSDSARSTPFRSRTSSLIGSKQPLGETHNHNRSQSLPLTAGTGRPLQSQSVSDSLSSQPPAAPCVPLELDTAPERNPTSLASSPAVTSKLFTSQRSHLRPHSRAGHLALSNQEYLSERRLSLPDLLPRNSISASYPSSPSNLAYIATEVVDTPRRLTLGDLRPQFGRKNPKKLAREGYPKPPEDKRNILDKFSTNKLTKFWNLSEKSDASDDRQYQESDILQVLANHPIEIRGRPVFRSRLTSISEHPSNSAGKLPSSKMDPSLLTPGSRLLADQQEKQRRAQEAKEMSATIARTCERLNTPLPPYEFLELIGKGTFGRVYKCRDERSGNLVAIKIANIEDAAFDDTVQDFQKEVSILQQLKSNKTKNVNLIHDAFDLGSQLWIVADYCTGGSVRTLLRAWEKAGKPSGLPQNFIIPIARELAIALKGLHDMQIIHRDIKCANVYITEDGDIQLGDFGVVGIKDDGNSKRKTVIGTPHYMSKELIDRMEEGFVQDGYGNEVDIWAYGCTILEMATGRPPLSWMYPEDMSKNMETKGAPRLEGSEYSVELCDMVAFCLKMDPKARPTVDDILKHPLIANTSKQYPTSSLVKLIERYKIWEHGGGSRQSLWMAAPSDVSKQKAEAVEKPSDDDDDDGEWNFSTSDDFDKRFSQMPVLQDGDLSYLQAPEGAGLPPGLPPIITQNLSIAERIKREHSEMSANRGERSLARVFNTSDETGYQLSSPPSEQTPPPAPAPPPSDLPLRNFTSNAPSRESIIDLDDADVNETATSTFALHMDAINENTIKPASRPPAFDEEDDDDFQYGQQEDATKRATMAWTFPKADAPQPKRGTMEWSFSTAEPAQPEESELSLDLPAFDGGGDLPSGFRPGLKHTATEPIGHFRDFSHDMGSSATSPTRQSVASMIDLDMGLVDPPRHLDDPADIRRPSTASSASGSTMTDMTSGNPFDLEDDPVQNELDRNRFSYHKQWQSEGGRSKRRSNKSVQMHARGSSLSSNDSGMGNAMASSTEGFGEPMPPSAMFDSLSLENEDMNQWPNFSAGFDHFEANTSPQYLPTLSDIPRIGDTSNFPLDRNLRANGLSTRSSREPSNEPPGPEVDFPDIVPPNPEALLDDADPKLLEDEFGHTMNDLANALTGVEQSLRLHGNIHDDVDDNLNSDTESGFESAKDTTTEDEDASSDAFLTARRKQPRSRSPHLS